ncbi:pentatricopeptide repeat-containing protein At5g18950-like [Telopea speciosissima]|uniref:pentatricopeptide repeat-containing protein At5g18950-like n=1 Tax=Telopea speciosissima TaxID=54955 RepID=UPI001CC4E3FC|nr:pentatricopeptide repeat-containing protein At5g18950-like [Telopea speciosissima]
MEQSTMLMMCFRSSKIFHFVPSLSVWNSAFLGSLRIGRTDLVWDLYAKMMESGLVGDVDTVGYLIRAFCKDNKLSKAYELLRQVIEAGHTPDNIVFIKLISGFCRDESYVKVSELLHLMIAKQKPNVEILEKENKNKTDIFMVEEGFIKALKGSWWIQILQKMGLLASNPMNLDFQEESR